MDSMSDWEIKRLNQILSNQVTIHLGLSVLIGHLPLLDDRIESTSKEIIKRMASNVEKTENLLG